MFTFAVSLHTDHQLVSAHQPTRFMAFDKSAINTTQHESRRHRFLFNEIQYESDA